jgi:hypothetical protein
MMSYSIEMIQMKTCNDSDEDSSCEDCGKDLNSESILKIRPTGLD